MALLQGKVFKGADSVTASGDPSGLDVYCFYTNGTFANGTEVKSLFPGKLYVGISPDGDASADCIDIEPGDAVPGDFPGFVARSTHPNLNKPMAYASLSNMQAIIDAATNAGIARSEYYLFVADWDGVAVIQGGFEADQFNSNMAFDSDLFDAGIFRNAVPALPGVPGNLAGAVLQPPEVLLHLTWDTVTDPKAGGIAGVYQWQLELDKGNGSWELIRSEMQTGNAVTVTGIDRGRSMRWRVSGGNWSDWLAISS